ncbi:MAG: hypothetical protein ACOC6F_00790 [bacterium]
MVGLIGLFVSFFGAALLAKTAVKSEREILNEAAPRLPIGPLGSEEYENSLRNMPNVQALLRQSGRAKSGLWILAIGFLLQFISALVLYVCPRG